jgi:hypothetical protein
LPEFSEAEVAGPRVVTEEYFRAIAVKYEEAIFGNLNFNTESPKRSII